MPSIHSLPIGVFYNGTQWPFMILVYQAQEGASSGTQGSKRFISNGSPMQVQRLQDPPWRLGLIQDIKMEPGDARVKQLLALPDCIVHPHLQLTIGIVPMLLQVSQK
jgi:hypothetical protein